MKKRETKKREMKKRIEAMSTPFQVCAYPLQIPIIGQFINHAYIEATILPDPWIKR